MYKKLLSLSICLSLALTIPLNVFAQTAEKENEIIKLYEKDFLFYQDGFEKVVKGESDKSYSLYSDELEDLIYSSTEAKNGLQSFKFKNILYVLFSGLGLSLSMTALILTAINSDNASFLLRSCLIIIYSQLFKTFKVIRN